MLIEKQYITTVVLLCVTNSEGRAVTPCYKATASVLSKDNFVVVLFTFPLKWDLFIYLHLHVFKSPLLCSTWVSTHQPSGWQCFKPCNYSHFGIAKLLKDFYPLYHGDMFAQETPTFNSFLKFLCSVITLIILNKATVVKQYFIRFCNSYKVF